MSLPAGTRLGPYELLAPLGAGGMGVVYRARDTRLHRDVALKILPDLFAADPDRLARFKREAQLLASLNHPNIAAIHGFEESDGLQALVLELVEGPTLADRIAEGPVPLDEALPIARQIAEAVEAAHEQGVVHRDLKPANIKVRPDGTVKVLDFGLAKAFEGEPTATGVSVAPTITSPAATRIGTILGTAAYMSPEQARGRPVDRRTDVWAFGCVLYELLTGRRAFDGEEVTDVLARILERDVDFSALSVSTPAPIVRLLHRALEKDRRRRLPDIGVARLEIDEALAGASPPVASAVTTRPYARHRLPLALAAGVAIGAATAVPAMWLMNRTAPPALVRLMVTLDGPETIGGSNTLDSDVAMSADGRRIAYVTGEGQAQRLLVRVLDQLEPIVLVGENARAPFISPDGSWVGFFGAGSTLQKVSITGGPAVTIAKVTGVPRGASWGPDDTIVVATGDSTTGLLRVPASGGEPEVLTKPGQGEDHFFPEILPGGQAVIYGIVPDGRVDDTQVAVLDLATRTSSVLISGGSNPRYALSGHLIYAVRGTLRAVPFDLQRLAIAGASVPVVDGVVTKGTGAANFAVAKNGSLVYGPGTIRGGAQRTLVWVDRQGREESIPVPPRAYTYARLSPDGGRVALDIRDQDNDVWIWDLARKTLTRLTFERGLNRSPVWWPDGQRLAFSSTRDGAENIYSQAADGTGVAERLVESRDIQVPTSISADGRVLFFNQPANPPYDLGVVFLQDRRSEMLLRMPSSEHNPAISPDGRWLAYQSDESGRDEIYVRPFPDANAGRWQLSTDGGTRPWWSRDGRELFYFLAPGRMMAVPVAASSAFSAGNPKELFSGRYFSTNSGRVYDVSHDGRRFLMIKDATPIDENADRQLVVVQNWFDELRRLVPP